MKKKHPRLRIFLTSFFATLCLIALALGFMEVDFQSRRIGFDDGKTLFYRLTGKNPDITCINSEICYNNLILLPTERNTEDLP